MSDENKPGQPVLPEFVKEEITVEQQLTIGSGHEEGHLPITRGGKVDRRKLRGMGSQTVVRPKRPGEE